MNDLIWSKKEKFPCDNEYIRSTTFSYRYEIYETYSEQSMRSELFITTTERTDGAIYTCLAQNEHGNDDRTVKLLILGE